PVDVLRPPADVAPRPDVGDFGRRVEAKVALVGDVQVVGLLERPCLTARVGDVDRRLDERLARLGEVGHIVERAPADLAFDRRRRITDELLPSVLEAAGRNGVEHAGRGAQRLPAVTVDVPGEADARCGHEWREAVVLTRAKSGISVGNHAVDLLAAPRYEVARSEE